MWPMLPGITPESPLDTALLVCHIVDVTLRFRLRPGEPIFDQVVFAAKRAFLNGEFLPGQTFPSVRALAAELKIHPNTAHKVVQHLIQEGFLEARPGVGTVVAELPEARATDKRRLLKQEVEQLVVEAMRMGLELPQVVEAIETQWASLERQAEASRK
jgi:GntR family transcriptional regulator